jgi:4-amino-4-deoxy-L-arabinose transferase-like glycosyltransferase
MVEMTETSNEKLITKIAVSIMALFLLVSWIPAFGMPLGDSHEGRVLGQFALHMKNFWSMGVVASSFGASWEPFSDIPYTHHPPVLTFLHVIVSSIIGEGLKQIKLISYVAGVLTIPALFSMGKNLGINSKAVTISILFLITTPWWWVYGRLGLGLLPNVLMIGTILAATEKPTKRKTVIASLATFFAVAASWHGVFLFPFLWFQTWRRRKFDQLTFSLMGASILGGLAILLWVSQGGGLSELGDHIGERVERDWTWNQFAERQWDFAQTLLPLWFTILALPALVVGLVDFRTRFLTTSLISMVLVFALVPSNGAWIHDYWNFPILLTLFPGFAVMSEWIFSFIKEKISLEKTDSITLGGFLLLASVLILVLQPVSLHENYFDETSDAGELVTSMELSSGQKTAWHLPQVPWPTWVSNKWNVPTASLLNAEDLGTVPSEDIVLFRIDRIPDWLDGKIEFAIEDQKGRYATVTAHVMKQHVTGVIE